MNITGIIAEYNPFHNGHLYQIETSKKILNSDFIVVVMSGNFTQRGEAAVKDKFTRANMALKNGADLVLELPLPFATASAERFARGSIALLKHTGIVNNVSFGSEHGSISTLKTIANCLNNPSANFNTVLKSNLKEGLSFPKSRELAILSQLNESNPSISIIDLTKIIQSPNNILGIEYLRAIDHLNATIQPFTIERLSAGYHDLKVHDNIASATAIRSIYHSGDNTSIASCMPSSSYTLFTNTTYTSPNMNLLMPFLHHKFMFSSQSDLYSIWDIPKDLINTFTKYTLHESSFEDLVIRCTSKTYSSSTVRRSLLRILLDIKHNDIVSLDTLELIPYIRVLGCKKDSSILLKQLIDHSTRPVITNFKSYINNSDLLTDKFLLYDIDATKLYHYLTGNLSLINQDFTQPFLMV